MISREFGGLYVLECDVCGADSEELFDTFEEAVEFKKARDNQWSSRRLDDDWEDVCGECR